MEHEAFMSMALAEARKAFEAREVPIGAVVVLDGQVIGRGHNLRERLQDPTAHAEILAIREAGLRARGWRLTGSTLYVTVEPCPMCFGAALQARVERLVYGAKDPKAGACGSVVDLALAEGFNHKVEVIPGILESECRSLLREFFQRLRVVSGGMPELAERARLENG
ncbi:MAG: tRNA adenosine(34) deaminase TadA [Bacillota bacterium]